MHLKPQKCTQPLAWGFPWLSDAALDFILQSDSSTTYTHACNGQAGADVQNSSCQPQMQSQQDQMLLMHAQYVEMEEAPHCLPGRS